MATINTTSFPESFNFVGNPIIVEAVNKTNVSDSSMHQTVIEVIAPLPSSVGETITADYTFECETTPGGTVSVDISSALRAILEPKEWNPLIWAEGYTISYPTAEFAVRVYDRYMYDGAIYDGDKSFYPTDAGSGAGYGAHAFLGKLSDLERYILSNHPDDFYEYLTFSRKPTSGERWGVGDLQLTSKYNSSTKKVESTVHRITDDEATLPTGHRQFLFVNSMGVYETVSAVMRESLSYTMESTVHSLAQGPTYKGSPSLSTHKTSPRATLQMSSGYTTREWADWWTTEFLTAKHCWVKMGLNGMIKQVTNEDGTVADISLNRDAYWIPCTVTPADEETLIFNRAEQRLPHVNFDVKLALSGSIVTKPNLTV